MSLNNEESVDLPLSIVHSDAPSNGVPKVRRFENTGEVERAVSAAINSDENTVEALAKLILGSQPKQGGGSGSGGGYGDGYGDGGGFCFGEGNGDGYGGGHGDGYGLGEGYG